MQRNAMHAKSELNTEFKVQNAYFFQTGWVTKCLEEKALKRG